MKQNKIFAIFIIIASLCGCGIQQPDGVSDKPYLITVNTISETLSTMSDKDSTLEKSVAQTGASPNDILQYNGSIYVLNSLSNSVTVYNEHTLKMTNEFSVGEDTNPYKFLILNGQLWITAYTTHQVLVFTPDGDKVQEINIPTVNNTYYPYPEGIATDGTRIFVACKDSADETAVTCNPAGGRIAVIRDNIIECYIQAHAPDTSSVTVSGDRLYILNSGTYNSGSGFAEDGIIESIALSDISSTGENETTVHASDNSFGVCIITGDTSFCGNLGNGTIIKYDISGTKWTQSAKTEFNGSESFAFISGMAYDSHNSILWVTEFNGNKLYRLDPANLTTVDQWTVSDNSNGDSCGILLLK